MSDDDRQRIEKRVTINKEFESFDAFIRSREPLPIGTEVHLTFTVIMDDVETIEGAGQVVRVQDDPPGMGVAFTKLTKYSEDLLARLLTVHGDTRARPA